MKVSEQADRYVVNRWKKKKETAGTGKSLMPLINTMLISRWSNHLS